MLCYVMLCYAAMLCYVMLCYVMLCYDLQTRVTADHCPSPLQFEHTSPVDVAT